MRCMMLVLLGILMPKTIEFWTVEHTGWSDGVSWFYCGPHDEPLRFKSFDKALQYAIKEKKEFNQGTTMWRVVHNTFERFENKEVRTKEWRGV